MLMKMVSKYQSCSQSSSTLVLIQELPNIAKGAESCKVRRAAGGGDVNGIAIKLCEFVESDSSGFHPPQHLVVNTPFDRVKAVIIG
ncbi:hypothetical protein CASFOL_042205 [Castilleja foliolosa]|uniref:Uncharacterized protein n=1 Tax=Castilleja foliolosa TaxID=1961234 RepID=A0ABD3BAM9_9LAMI